MFNPIPFIQGWEDLSPDYCNRPFRVVTDLSYEPRSVDMFAAILICGRPANHEGKCDELPPIEEFERRDVI